MSFNRSSALESQSTTTRREDDPEYSDDPKFKQFAKSLSDKLFGLTHNINQLAAEIAHLGTLRENERVRERVQELIESTGAGFKDVGEGLKEIAVWPDLGPTQRFAQGKLNREFQASLANFQVLQRQAIDKQKASRAALEQEQQLRSPGAEGQSSTASSQQQQQLQQQQLAPQSEVDFQESLIIEREVAIRGIEQSVGELNELFRDVATMVQEQGTQLDHIAITVDNVHEDTRGGYQELTQAQRHQRSARSKACCLLFVLAIVLIVVILAVVLS